MHSDWTDEEGYPPQTRRPRRAKAQGPLSWLYLQIVLICIGGKVVWSWFKAKLPSRKPQLHCGDCGWRLPWDTASLICGPCGRLRASKLFCCDVDLTLLASWTRIHPGWQRTTTDRYCCSACGRIWFYVTEEHKDSGSESDWYPQWAEAELASNEPPSLFDERTRTKVYRW